MSKNEKLEKEIVNLTQELIEFESISERQDELESVVGFVEKYLKKNANLSIQRFKSKGKPSLIATLKKTNRPKIFLHDHLDVVPGNPEQFKPFVKGNKLFGRGASDTKGNGAAMLVLAKNLSKLEKNPNVGFMFTTDEEIGGFDGVKYLLNKGFRCKFFITMEPTDFDIVHIHKGILWLRVLVKGKSAHASRPWDGDNAFLNASEGVEKLYKVFPILKKESWRTTVNIGSVNGGDAFNKVMGDCELKIDIRYVEKDKLSDILNKVRKCFKGSRLEVVEDEPMMSTPKNSRFIKELSKTVKKVTGKAPKIKKGHGGCDGRHYSKVGIPAVELGTVSHGIHMDEEWLEIKKLQDFYKILEDFVLKIC